MLRNTCSKLYILREKFIKESINYNNKRCFHNTTIANKDAKEKQVKKNSSRIEEFRKKIRETTPIKDLGEQKNSAPQKEDPLPPWPNSTNPNTGEIGGPRGPEPTRYGDWERKGRVSDF